MRQITLSPLSILILSIVPAMGAPDPVSFNEDVQPILSEYCYQCHGPDSSTRAPKTAPLRLDREEFAFEMREGLGAPVIIKGDAAASEFIRRLQTKDPNELMPPAKSHKTMKADEIAVLEKWITEGAEYEEHWAFIPPTRPALPELPEELQGWPKNLIDYFTASRLAAAGMQPNPVEAPRRFLRRLSFDLTGLPPKPEELDAFDAAWEANPDLAVHAAIDRLLASPAYGEHFARHWLDAARYSDTHGIHIDNYRSIWPYRDWVIKAYRQNMPFDQFTIEQIGGDLLPDATLDQIVATGFNRCLATTGEGGAIAEEYDAIYAQDRTNTTAAVWLGLTAGCAACHDHKFDPISTKDTYSFNAFFRNTTMTAMDRNKADHPPNIFVPRAADRSRSQEIDAEAARIGQLLADRGKDAGADFQAWLAKLDPASFQSAGPAPEILRQILAATPDQRTEDQSTKLRNHFLAAVDPVSAGLRDQKQTLEAERQPIRQRGAVSLIMQEKPGSEASAHILTRGDYSQKAGLVTADVPEILPDLPADAPRNRLGLARWLVARDNPLSARVTANRTWYYVFGRGIVETTEDFGIMGSRPSHPQLLDWLAVEFMDSGWNYQHLLRTIVSSATYRQSQSVTPRKLEKDPLNVLFTRGPRYRLEAEQIRDLALSASGLLVDEVGGPSVKPYQPGGVWEAVAMKGSNTRHYKADTGENLYRRSIYTFHKRTAPHPSMDIFNAPTREVFCVRRERTNTPLQAFVTMNDVQFVEAARQLATTALKATADPAGRLDLIYERLLARPPRDEERPVLTASLDGFLQAYQATPDEAAKLIKVGDSPTDPDLDPVELAAWTLLASNILNLDETLTK